ncbi:Crp/Fnr family transcriptional regulator [Sphaerotilus montanus]|uniref:CRP-like cAMP-binding protein n=1 Tax=Sphaerotilus montanus TaxID=522889 RepID=A0A7Y9U5W8_9BURK|nr:Crp/Fnr family transcriptional regulator [Sphaerotilus montanus]NYG32006.1 CRP-like cAMP-binding protein [Sphaerotilus montanus]
MLSASILAPADVDLLMRLAHRRTVAAGDAVLDRSAPAHALVLLLSGDVVLGSRAADGSLRTERSVTGPAWLDVSAAWLGQPHAMEAQALSDVVVADLPLDAVRNQMSIHPTLAQQFCETLAQQVQQMTMASRNLLHNDAPARLAQWLLQRLPQRSGQAELRLQERKRDIAQQLAMSPETLSRLMRSFELRGVLSVRGYQVQVRDVDELRALAGTVA